MLHFDDLKNCKDERAKESVAFYLDQAEDTGLSFYYAIAENCLLLMGKDEDGVVFFPPESLEDGADIDAALDEVDRFAGAACIDRIFVGLDEEWEDFFALRYRHHEITDMGDGFSGFRVLTELHALEKVEPITGDVVSLAGPTEEDESFLKDLAEETKDSLYGYRADRDGIFEEIKNEWENRHALSLLIFKEKTPVGEVTLFSFDGRKKAEVAVRVSEKHRKVGYAKEALREVIAFCQSTLHLDALTAEVKVENIPSLHLFSSVFIKEKEEDGIVFFRRNL